MTFEHPENPLPAPPACAGTQPETNLGRDLETIAALSRIRYDADCDVTDFLEFVRKKKYLLAGIDFDSAPPLRGGLSGNQALSAEQAAALRREYDTANLPSGEQYALFQRLTELEVLSVSDVKQTQYSVAPGKNDLMGYLAEEEEFRDVAEAPETRPKERLCLMIENERFASLHVQNRYGQSCGAVDRLADSHQKVLDALQRI